MSPQPHSDTAAHASFMASFNWAHSIVVNYLTKKLELLGLEVHVINWACDALNHHHHHLIIIISHPPQLNCIIHHLTGKDTVLHPSHCHNF